MFIPTLTIDEVSQGIDAATSNNPTKKILTGLLNDYMNLQYGIATPYTTGKHVVPTGANIGDVDKALADGTTEKIYKAVFQVISDVHKSGDLTPRTKHDGTWDAKLMQVLVQVIPNK